MARFLVPLLISLSSATSLLEQSSYNRPIQSAASAAQIKFAVENKYDDTGPGAKGKEFAYNTYSNLEDALVAYLDDPDTKLPEHERAKAVNKLLRSQFYTKPQSESFFRRPEQYQGNSFPKVHFRDDLPGSFFGSKPVYPKENKFAFSSSNFANDVLKSQQEKRLEPFRLQKLQPVKSGSLNLGHYQKDRDLESAFGEFNPHPKYTYSYGVNDKSTGDVKQASESREGGVVHGFYSFMDPDGKQRTVHYTADNEKGFRATVKRES